MFEGIDLKSGNIKRVVINNKAVKTAVNPVLPPSSTPLALSINAVVVETPNKLPPTVAIASASSVFCNDLSFLLFSWNRFALVPTPVKVPKVSNISVIKNVIITGNKDKDKALKISNFKNIGEIEEGAEKKSVGVVLSEKLQATIEVIAIDKINAPLSL